MLLAALLSTAKAFWSLLIASALVWSGVDLSFIPSGDKASPPGASSSGIVSRQIGDTPAYFDPDAGYRILTQYGSATQIALDDFLASGVSGVTFSLVSCDPSRSDYYRSAAVESGTLKLESNTLGHVHGSSTQTETVCTVSATGSGGDQSQDFSLYTVSDRTPLALLPDAVTVTQTRADEMDLQVDMPEASLGYLRLGWRVPGGQPSFAVAHGVTDDTVLTISGLQASTSYEIRAYAMTAQAFDLYRYSNTGAAGTLIAEGSPAAKWISNLVGSGLGKSQSISQATLPPSTRPTPDVDDDEDDLDLDTPTPTPTDNDGIDTPTPTPTDNDGIDTPTPTPTDNDGIDTPTPTPTDNDGIDTPTPTPTDNDGIDTPTPTPTDNDGIDTPTPTPTDNDGIDTPTPTPTDNDGIDTPTPTPTDNDGIDTPTPTPTDNDSIDTPTPTPTDNDGTDSDGVDTPVVRAVDVTDNDGTDSDGIDTPTPTDGVDTPTPSPVTPPTPSPVTPDTPTPVTPPTPSPVTPPSLDSNDSVSS